jgi:hypothetical protein
LSESGTTMEQPAVTGGEPPRRRWAPWVQLAAIAVSFAVIGFVAGWILRGEGGTVSELPAASTEITTATTAEPDSATQTSTQPEPQATPESDPGALPARADVTLVVLNGGTVDGLANQTADEAEGLGYVDVIADNAPTQEAPTIVYFAPGNQAAADRAATDLEIATVEALPESGDLAVAASQAAPSGSDVVVVLGTQ